MEVGSADARLQVASKGVAVDFCVIDVHTTAVPLRLARQFHLGGELGAQMGHHMSLTLWK